MKTPPSRRERGFTLIELLVVIVIIAILAAASFAVGRSAIEKARKTTALATCTAIESAVSNFYTEYGTMPVDALTADTLLTTKSSDTVGVKFLTVLLGLESTLNTRSIKFLNVKEGKSNRNGLIYDSTGTTVQGLYDPWGGGYNVMLDGDYNEQVTVKPKGTGSTSRTLNGRRVACWSDGADAASGTSSGKTTDDVYTWN